MTLHTTLAIWAFAAVLSLATVALVLWQVVIVLAAALVVSLVVSLGAGLVTSNITGVADGERARAENAFIQIESSFTLTGTLDSPVGDISGGNNTLDDPAYVHDIAAGRIVTLRTKSGKPATLQLFSTDTGIVPVVTYDGKEDPTINAPFEDSAGPGSGFPQVLPLPGLPSRS